MRLLSRPRTERSRSVGLQLRIGLLAILGLSVAFGAFAFLGLRAVEEFSAQIQNERLAVARSIAGELDRSLDHTLHMLALAAARDGVDPADDDPEPERHALHDAYLLAQLPTYRMLLLDRDGRVLLAEPVNPGLIGLDLSGQAFVQEGLRGRSSVSDALPAALLGQPVVALSVPVRDAQGEVAGLLVQAVDLLAPGLGELLHQAQASETGYAQLVDGQGTVIAATRPETLLREWEHRPVAASLLAAKQPQVSVYPAAGSQKGADLLAFAPLSTAGWGVSVEQEVDEALAPIQRLRRQFLSLGLAVLLTALLLVWVTTGQVVRPVRELTAAARRIAGGELDGPIPPTLGGRGAGEDEIGELARAFEEMRANIQRRTAELESLREVSLDITAQLELSGLLRGIVRRAAELLGATGGALYLYHSEQEELKLVVSHNLGADYAGTRQALGEGAMGRVAQTGEPIIVQDYAQWEGRSPQYVEGPWHAVMAVPLVSRGRLIGAIGIVDADPARQFTSADLRLLDLFARQAAIAIENARLLERERQQRQLAEALHEAGVVLSSTLNFETVLDCLLEQIARVIPYDAANIMLVEEGRSRVARLRGYEQFGEQTVRDIASLSFEIARTANLRRMAETGQPLIIPDTAADPEWVKVEAAPFVRSWAGAPIMIQDQVIAFFSLDKVEPHFYRPEHARYLAAFAGQAAMALQNARLHEAERQRAAEAETLQRATAALISTLELEELLAQVLENLERVVRYDSATVMLVEKDSLRVAAARGFPETAWPLEVTISAADDPFYQEARATRRPVILSDAQADPRFRRLGGTGYVRGWICAPLLVKDQVIGVLTVDNREPASYTAAEAAIVQTFAHHAALAVENARIYHSERRRAAQLAAINAIGKQATLLEPEQLFQAIVRSIQDNFGYYRVGLHLVDHTAQETIKVAAAGAEAEVVPMGHRQQFGQGMIGQVAQTGEQLLVRDSRRDPRHLALHQTAARSALAMPVKVGDELVAVLNMESDQVDAFDEEDVMALETLSDQLAVAIKNARLHQQISHQAITDGLTGLYNVRYFYQTLEKELERSRRYGHHCSLIMLDLDNFKKYNDRFGHLAGDDLLRELADLIREVSRWTDTAARYGGEEFAVILPETDGDQARVLAERLRQTVRDHEFVVRETQRLGRITISVGVAGYPKDGEDVETLVEAADKALLRAKEGKDRVCVAGEAALRFDRS